MPESLHPGVYVEETSFAPRPIAGNDTGSTGFVGQTRRGPVGEPVAVTSEAELHRRFGRRTRTWGLGTAVADFFANGGRWAVIVRLPDEPTLEDHEDALAALSRMASSPSILVLPPRRPQQRVADAVWAATARWALAERTFLLIDPPPGLQPDQVADWSDSLGLEDQVRRNAAVYYPRVRRTAPRPDRADLGAAAACGAIAGVYARTDQNRGVWKAPAGSDAGLAGVVSAETALSDSTNGVLNAHGINAIRDFPGRGTLLWGARTLHGAGAAADEYKYVPVRRLALHLQRSIEHSTAWAVSEPNSEQLWSSLRLTIGSHLEGLWRQGAFAGSRPQEAYLVRCDATTTTQADIAHGVVNIFVGFAPLKPAEFVTFVVRQQVTVP